MWSAVRLFRKIFDTLFREIIFFFTKPAENFFAGVHHFKLFSVGIFNFNGFFVLVESRITFAELFGNFGEVDVQLRRTGIAIYR